MEKKVAGLIGAMTAIAAVSPSQAAPASAMEVRAALQANSYADLLKPIPNAAALLKVSDESAAEASLLAPATEGDATVQDAQFYYHHHHHHHFEYRPRFYPRFYYHHHHGYYRPFYHHHHHFHHHHFFDESY